MNPHIDKLKTAIEPVRQQIVHHPLYSTITSLDDLRIFTQFHVFAVWDFMSLLKGLQQQLTCVQYPWVPVGHANTRYLINEIVTGEESDVDEQGRRCSHYELYCRAMEQLGASTSDMQALITLVQQGVQVQTALKQLKLPAAIQQFVQFTFDTLDQQDAAITAAVFTFGREDLIPDMFYSLVKDLELKFPGQLSIFKYYLERHIEVDGDHHSLLAMEMVQELCGGSLHAWDKATKAARRALELRKLLWDGAYENILATKELKSIINFLIYTDLLFLQPLIKQTDFGPEV
ncbi:DUF3050 domain-containing protein [Paraflavitalea speifideaquila]|uniref:DUF3050 domain-containing protein n=1 Tax=Paraflavitalea speifideaquila TaxID=3076558 RepID=UPI0028E44481|nr:DUF3050 domain-containing protein [Paraflavitalea speifideiaquila]